MIYAYIFKYCYHIIYLKASPLPPAPLLAGWLAGLLAYSCKYAVFAKYPAWLAGAARAEVTRSGEGEMVHRGP